MNYLITPPNTHYDGGLGITAYHFKNAAEVLKNHRESMVDILPLCYLQRHAIELFLKSLIVILHKKFQVPYGDDFPINRLSETHNIYELYKHFSCIYLGVMDNLPEIIRMELPSDIEGKIKLISGSDPKSTYFRYPVATNPVQDAKKSEIQRESLDSMLNKTGKSGKPFKCVLMLDHNDDILDSYNLKSSPLPKVINALDELNDFFNIIHAAFRVELTNFS